jgi:hypothetical protein
MADLARNFCQAQSESADQPPVTGNDLPHSADRTRSHDERHENSMVADTLQQVVSFGVRITVNGQTEIVRL